MSTTDWAAKPNISQPDFGNGQITIDVSGTVSGTLTQTYTAVPGFYTQEQLINWVVARMNEACAAPINPVATWSVAASTTQQAAEITVAANPVYIGFSGPIAQMLNIDTGGALIEYDPAGALTGFPVFSADCRGIRYVGGLSQAIYQRHNTSLL